jgi:hypothetical protein
VEILALANMGAILAHRAAAWHSRPAHAKSGVIGDGIG